MKVSVIGAGNVGATAADVMATRSICSEIVLLDIKAVSYTHLRAHET